MPLAIDVKPFSLNGVITGDRTLTHYKAVDAKGDAHIITEFNPTYMTQRADDGKLEIMERFTKEFTRDREVFYQRMEAFQEIKDNSIHPVADVFERNNTVYMARRACGLTTIDQFMGGQHMEYKEAYVFVRPLLTALALAAEKGVMFAIEPQDFRVNSFKQVVLNGLLSWDSDFHPVLIQIVGLYYRLVTGVNPPKEDAPSFSVYGVDIPPRLESVLMEILKGDILYGSLDDFYKKFKSLVEGTEEVNSDASEKSLALMRGFAAVLIVVFLFSLVGLAYAALTAYRSGAPWADPMVFASSEPRLAPERDFSAVALTHPRDRSDVLTGSFGIFDGFMFTRHPSGVMRRRVEGMIVIPGAAGILDAAEDNIILQGVRPSFFVGHDSWIYFVDSASSGAIYRSAVNGNNLMRVTDSPALNLVLLDGILYFTNPDNNNFLYRIHLDSLRVEMYLPMPAFHTVTDGSRLYFMSGEPGSLGIFALDPTDANVIGIVESGASHGLQIVTTTGMVGNVITLLYYVDSFGQVQSIDTSGRPVATFAPTNVSSFDVFFHWLIFVEKNQHIPRAYHMDMGTMHTLSSRDWVSYVWVNDAIVYGIDHRNPDVIHTFDLP